MDTHLPLKVTVNHAQQRVVTPRINVSLTAADYDEISPVDPAAGENVWRIPVCGALAIRPSCLHPQWGQMATGLYAKLGPSDLGLSSNDWFVKRDTPGARRLYRQSGTATTGTASAGKGVNRGWYFSFFAFDLPSGAPAAIYAECGWGGGSTGVALRIWSDGQIEVYKEGKIRGTYKLGLSSGASKANNYVNLVIMPMRRRELLILNASSGEAVIHVDADLSETDDLNVIVPDLPFFFKIPTGQPDVEIAPLRFPTGVKVYSAPYAFGVKPKSAQTRASFLNRPPFDGITSAKILGDDTGYTGEGVSGLAVTLEDGAAAYSAGSGASKIRNVLTLVSDTQGQYTPTIYGTEVAWSDILGTTDGSEQFDVTSWITSARWDHADDPLGNVFSIELKRSPDVIAAGLDRLDNLPCRIQLGATTILDGFACPDGVIDSINPEARRVQLRVTDGASALERQAFRDRRALDWYLLTQDYAVGPSAVSTLFRSVGITSLQFATDTFRIGAVAPLDCSQFNFPTSVKSSPARTLSELVDSFAYGYVWGTKPTSSGIVGFFRPPYTSSDPIAATVYARAADAIAAGVPASQVWSDYREDPLPIEGNEVRVQGVDPRSNVVVSAWGEDVASKDATKPPSQRADNWCGEDRVVGFQSPRLTRRSDCQRLVSKTLPIVSAKRYTCSWRGGLILKPGTQIPAWRGDLVTLNGMRERVPIASFSVEFGLEMQGASGAPAVVFREASYVGGAVTGRGARSREEQRSQLDELVARAGRLFGQFNPIASISTDRDTAQG